MSRHDDEQIERVLAQLVSGELSPDDPEVLALRDSSEAFREALPDTLRLARELQQAQA